MNPKMRALEAIKKHLQVLEADMMKSSMMDRMKPEAPAEESPMDALSDSPDREEESSPDGIAIEKQKVKVLPGDGMEEESMSDNQNDEPSDDELDELEQELMKKKMMR